MPEDNNQEIRALIENLKNPESGKTLGVEGRVTEVTVSGQELSVTYNRDGISPKSKRDIENQVIDATKGLFDEDSIMVKTVSSSSEDVYRQTSPAKENPQQQASSAEQQGQTAEKATLQQGHGPTGANKKRVQGVKNVVGVASGKGGVGKSTVAVNLACSLKNQGFSVGILDADIYGPSLPMLLNMRGEQPRASDEKKILPLEVYGLKFISFGLFIKESDPVVWRGPMLGGVLNQFLFDVDWGELDYLIIDLPPGTGDMQLSMAQTTEVDGIVIVSTPQDVALVDSQKGLKMFETVKVPVLGMVENMSYFVPDDMPDKKYYIFGEGGVEKACEQLGTEFFGKIPLEIALREGSDKGEPYMTQEQNEGRPVWEAYTRLAQSVHRSLTGEKMSSHQQAPKGFFQRLFQR